MAIQKFIHTDNKKCQISPSNTALKHNHPCFVRHGVEPSKTQSFVACIADILMIKSKQVINIKLMKNLFINALTLDNFMTLQNGNLVEIFSHGNGNGNSNGNGNGNEGEEVNIADYVDTKLYKNIDMTNKLRVDFLKKVITAYNNFINYLNDETIEIDHTYLWDLISLPNPKLFPNGLNIVILELNNNDITDNIQILCPSNHYSSNIFDKNKETIILMKIASYYEPIYIIENKNDKSFTITSQFNLKEKGILPNIKMTLDIIKKSLNTKCLPFSSMPSVYKFNKSIILEKLVDLLKTNEYEIVSQVMNYNGKIIGVLASKENITGFIPCFPSAPITDLTPEFTWMDDDYGNDYSTTIKFLTMVYQDTNEKIPCKPIFKIIDDGFIVGILTQTNQFVILSEPAENIFDDDLQTIEENNLMIVDKLSTMDKTTDSSRIEYIRKIRFESSFYNAFRNTMRFLIGEFKNRELRTSIEKIILSSTSYLNKLQQIDTLLRELMQDDVIFSDYSDKDLSELGTLSNCYKVAGADADANMCGDKKFCKIKEDEGNDEGKGKGKGSCALVIPKKNLINEQNNETLYFGRIADELIRYNRIRSFIFQPKSFLAFSSLKYNLRDDEIILLQTLLTQEYFEDIIPAPVNKYISNNTYDTAQPVKTQIYSNEIGTEDVIECDKTVEKKLPPKIGKLFPNKSSELIFSNDPELCSFDIILTLIKDNNKNSSQREPKIQSLTKYHLKELLVKEYNKLEESYTNQILEILSFQGKTTMTKLVSSGQVSLSSTIMSYDYYATNLDIWILAVKFNIPLVFLSEKNLLENGLQLLVAHNDSSNSFYFILSPAIKAQAPIYKLIVAPDGSFKIPLENVKEILKKDVNDNTLSDALIEFIKNFSLEETSKLVKSDATKMGKKLKLVVSDE